MTDEMKNLINNSVDEGINTAKKDLKSMKIDSSMIATLDISVESFYEQARENRRDIFKDIKTRLDGNREFNHVEAVINALEYRFRFMIEYILPKVVWYSYSRAGEITGIKKAKVIFGDSSDADAHNEIVYFDTFSLDDIPAFHPFCDCKMKFLKSKEGNKR